MRNRNYFYNLIRNEDTFTEAFVNILSNENVKNKFVEILKSKKPSIEFDFEDIRTQAIGPENDRPDIIVENKDVLLIIENKININTDTTVNQKNGYENIFKNTGNQEKLLLFIIPRMYKKINVIDDLIDNSKNKKVVVLKEYWEDLIEKLKNATDDKIFNDFINTTYEFLNYQIIKIGEKDMKHLQQKNNIESFINTIGIMENLSKIFKTEGYKVEKDIDEYNYGIHLIDNNTKEYLIYIGIVYDNWIETGEPFYLGYTRKYKKKVTEKVEKENINNLIKYNTDDYYYLIISIKDLLGKNDGTNYIKEKVDYYLN